MKLIGVLCCVLLLAGCASKPPTGTSTPIAETCIETNGLPDHNCTPGVINPLVNQSNVLTTICVSSWTRTIRPPTSYTNPLKIEQIKQYNYYITTSRSYEEDHLIPLELGGSPVSPQNLWPEPRYGTENASVKDKIENGLHHDVCTGSITLVQAQQEIATDWETIKP